MNDLNSVIIIMLKVTVAGFGAVGIVEYLKNFIKTTKKTWIYSLIMPFISVGCYCAIELLPIAVIGSILTIGAVQLNYQVIVQGFKKILNACVSKIGGNDNESN